MSQKSSFCPIALISREGAVEVPWKYGVGTVKFRAAYIDLLSLLYEAEKIWAYSTFTNLFITPVEYTKYHHISHGTFWYLHQFVPLTAQWKTALQPF